MHGWVSLVANHHVQALERRRLFSAILRVGPGEPYALPSQAIAAAHDGDTIQIATGGNYYNDVAAINKNNLTIEGVGAGRALMQTDGRVYDNKGIWLFEAGYTNLTIRNIDFEGARVADALGGNGAGLRTQGNNLTVINCRFYNNQDGILGGAGTTDIERSEFADNGLSAFTHNVYIASGTLIFRYNYSHDTLDGHLLKSRAAVNEIEYNRLADDAGSGSYELDLPNGGRCDIVGNLIEQGPNSQNGNIIAYGEEGLNAMPNELNVVNNTLVNDRSSGTFIWASHLTPAFRLAARNDIFAGPGTTISMDNGLPMTGGNLVVSSPDAAGFVSAASFNYRLLKSSPAINIGVSPGADSTGFSLMPTQEYVHPVASQPRPVDQRIDAGAYEYAYVAPPKLISATSLKTHGAAGDFSLPLNISGVPAIATIEPRRQGSNDRIVLTFSKAIFGSGPGQAAIPAEFSITNGAISWASISGNQLTLGISSVTDRAVLAIHLNGLMDISGNSLAGVSTIYVKELEGDVRQSGMVSVADYLTTRAHAVTSIVDSGSFLEDVDLSGTVNVADLLDVRKHFFDRVASR